MIRKFALKQPDAVELASTSADPSGLSSGVPGLCLPSREPVVPECIEQLPYRRSQVGMKARQQTSKNEMKSRSPYEGSSFAEVMAEKRRATAAIINGDLDQQLRYAASQGDVGTVRELIDQGARILPDKKGRTALHYAALSGYAEVVRLLLDCGVCHVDALDASGYTALHKAAGNGHLDVIELLIENGRSEVDLQDASNGNTALHEAAWNGYCKTVQLLLANKSNAYAANKAGCTALHLAAQNGHNQTSRTLLHAGCSPDVKNNYGDTPLHTATRYGHAGVTRILIRAKCSISEQNNNGDTSLHIAAAFRRRKISRLLVEGGIDFQLRNKQGETALDTACRKENHEILDIIKSSVPRAAAAQKYSRQPEHDDAVGDSSETNEASLEIKAAPAASTAQAKPRSNLISWLKDRLTKDKRKQPQLDVPRQGRDALALDAASWKDPKQRMQRQKSSGSGSNSSQSGLFSQYVKQPGMAFYRDLAGNVRQGPAGYVPLYRHAGGRGGGHAVAHLGVEAEADPEHGGSPYAVPCPPLPQEQPIEDAYGRRPVDVPEQPIYAEVLHFDRRRQNAGIRNHNQPEAIVVPASRRLDYPQAPPIRTAPAVPEQLFVDDPFAYSSGVVQHFADDYRQEQYIRYEVSDLFPNQRPLLFRSRSDETLSHSEYSYHGRAFKSREAAARELRVLQEREKLRETRRQKRIGAEPGGATFSSGGRDSTVFDIAPRLVNMLDGRAGRPPVQQSSMHETPWRGSLDALNKVDPRNGRADVSVSRSNTRGYLSKGASLHQICAASENDRSGPLASAYFACDSVDNGCRSAAAGPPSGPGFHGQGLRDQLATGFDEKQQETCANSAPPRFGSSAAAAGPSHPAYGCEYANLSMLEQQCDGVRKNPTDAERRAASLGTTSFGDEMQTSWACASRGLTDRSCNVFRSSGDPSPSLQPRLTMSTSMCAADSECALNSHSRSMNASCDSDVLRSNLKPTQASAVAGNGVAHKRDFKGAGERDRLVCLPVHSHSQQHVSAIDLYGEQQTLDTCWQPASESSPSNTQSSAPSNHALRTQNDARVPASGVAQLSACNGCSTSAGVDRTTTRAGPTQFTTTNESRLDSKPRVNQPFLANADTYASLQRRGAGNRSQPPSALNACSKKGPASAAANAASAGTAARMAPRGAADAYRDCEESSTTHASLDMAYESRLPTPTGTTGLTSPRVDGSIGSNPDSGYGSKAGEHPYGSEGTPTSTVDVQSNVMQHGDRLRLSKREPPSYESWYSQQMHEARKLQSSVSQRNQRRVISTFTTDV